MSDAKSRIRAWLDQRPLVQATVLGVLWGVGFWLLMVAIGNQAASGRNLLINVMIGVLIVGPLIVLRRKARLRDGR